MKLPDRIIIEPQSLEVPLENDDVRYVDKVNEYQARYQARSSLDVSHVMIPANMANAVQIALDKIEKTHGDIDEYVSSRLGWTLEEMSTYLSPEQIDSVALALGKPGFILADQTGLGKGRILASLARASALAGKEVVFMTEKANLFSDFWRDITDINSADLFKDPFILNDKTIISNDKGEALFKSLPTKEIAQIIQNKALPVGCNIMFGTYSQFNRKGSKKVDFLQSIAKDKYFISDESHNIVGDSNTALNIDESLEHSSGIVYSSATFARNAENISSYKHIFPDSIDRKRLPEVLRTGGVALREALSQTLTEEGVLIRREHDLSDITIKVVEDTKREERNRKYADELAPVLRKMAKLSLVVGSVVEEFNDLDPKKKPPTAPNMPKPKWQTGNFYTANFGSGLSGILRQFVTALKVDQTIEESLALLKKGEKPVIVIENTMEALMRELTEVEDTAIGKAPSFSNALDVMLERMMIITHRLPKKEKEKLPVDSEEAISLYEEIKELIDNFPELSLSPIDDIKNAISNSGYTADEISGRGVYVENGEYIKTPKRDRNNIIADFNNGATDFLIITRAASTGLSLHSSEKTKDHRKRVMIELQIPSNVVERIQFWGRVNRRGQINIPDFMSLSTGLPFEIRLLAMQNIKVSELSANVTASKETANKMNVPDLLNSIGNDVCRRVLESRPSLAEDMGIKVKIEDGEDLYFVNKLLSRLCLLESDRQDALYDHVVLAYKDAMDRYKNHLDGNWTLVERTLFNPGVSSNFNKPVYLTTIEQEVDRNPKSSDFVQKKVADSLLSISSKFQTSSATPFSKHKDFIKNNREVILSASLRRGQTVKSSLDSPKDNAVKKMYANLYDLQKEISILAPGGSLVIPNEEGEIVEGIILDIKAPDLKQAHYPGKYIIEYLFPGDEISRKISLAGIMRDSRAVLCSRKEASNINFDKIPKGKVIERRQVLDGNLFQAVQNKAGTALSYYDKDSVLRRGVLIPKSKRLNSIPGKTGNPRVAFELLRNDIGPLYTDFHNQELGLSISVEGNWARIEIPGNASESKMFRTPEITSLIGSYVGNHNSQSLKTSPANLIPLMEILSKSGYNFYYHGQHREKAVSCEMQILKVELPLEDSMAPTNY